VTYVADDVGGVPPFLQLVVRGRDPDCAMRSHFQAEEVAYLPIARAGSETLGTVFGYHDHDCTLRDMEKRGARRILVTLRHPLARISSGVARRLEGKGGTKRTSKRLFLEYFNEGGAEAYIKALRDELDPFHDVAMEVTVGGGKQDFMVPITEFYLDNSLGLAGVTFLCLETLEDDYEAAFQRWGTEPKKLQKKHTSNVSSGNSTSVLLRFSPESIQWVAQTYAADIALYKKHCPEGFRKFEKE
jgi:hypothetical protein